MMDDKGSYVPPKYTPLGPYDLSPYTNTGMGGTVSRESRQGPVQLSSGLCACFDDMESCCVGLFCPCYLFGKNAEFLGSTNWTGPCLMHLALWGIWNFLCCIVADGAMLSISGFLVAYYACSFRGAVREKYNLQEGPCNDIPTHMFCHQCAICQEYREIRERSRGIDLTDFSLTTVAAPEIQTMESSPTNNTERSARDQQELTSRTSALPQEQTMESSPKI